MTVLEKIIINMGEHEQDHIMMKVMDFIKQWGTEIQMVKHEDLTDCDILARLTLLFL